MDGIIDENFNYFTSFLFPIRPKKDLSISAISIPTCVAALERQTFFRKSTQKMLKIAKTTIRFGGREKNSGKAIKTRRLNKNKKKKSLKPFFAELTRVYRSEDIVLEL